MRHALRTAHDDQSDPPPIVPTEDLVRLVARGDQQAFEVLFARMSAPVYGICRRVLRDQAQSEEVAQEVLLWVWREASRFDPDKGSAMAWVMTVAHRRAVDRVRSEQSASARQQRNAQQNVETSYDSVSEDVLSGLERDAVRKCLSALTAVQRESVTLAYYGGHTYNEVAEMLQIPLGTTKTRIRDGLCKLRDCLSPPG